MNGSDFVTFAFDAVPLARPVFVRAVENDVLLDVRDVSVTFAHLPELNKVEHEPVVGWDASVDDDLEIGCGEEEGCEEHPGEHFEI